MARTLLIAVGCILAVGAVWSGWKAHQNKARFEAVMAERAQPPRR